MNVSLEKKEIPLSVLSFSCGGIYANEGLRLFRLHALTAHIASQHYDLVALQECWMQEDFEYIENDLKAILSHSHYFERGGIVILSKYPIISPSYTKLTDEDIVRNFFGTDYITEEGCGSICLSHSDIGMVHFFACYMNPPSAFNCSCRQNQRRAKCIELYGLMQQPNELGRKVIVAGNFHSEESDFSNISSSKLIDSWLLTEPNCDIAKTDPGRRLDIGNEISAEKYAEMFGVTFGSPLNTFTSELLLRDELQCYNGGERHDHIYYFESPHITCQQSRVAMKEYIPYTNLSYSDHFGIHCIFSISVYVNRQANLKFIQPSRPDFPKQTSFKSQYEEEYNLEKQQPSSSFNGLLPRYSKTEDGFGGGYEEERSKRPPGFFKLVFFCTIVFLGYRFLFAKDSSYDTKMNTPAIDYNADKANIDSPTVNDANENWWQNKAMDLYQNGKHSLNDAYNEAKDLVVNHGIPFYEERIMTPVVDSYNEQVKPLFEEGIETIKSNEAHVILQDTLKNWKDSVLQQIEQVKHAHMESMNKPGPEDTLVVDADEVNTDVPTDTEVFQVNKEEIDTPIELTTTLSELVDESKDQICIQAFTPSLSMKEEDPTHHTELAM